MNKLWFFSFFFLFMCCSWPLCSWPQTQVNVNICIHNIYFYKTAPLSVWAFLHQNVFTADTRSLPHPSSETLPSSSLFCVSTDPSAAPCPTLGIYVFISLWVRGCFGCSIQWMGETRAHLNSHRSGHWRPHLNWIWPVRLYHLFYALLTCTYIHICSQFSSEVGSHTRKPFKKWFLLELLSYKGCCKRPTVAIQSHGGTMGMEGSRLLQQLNNA